jgi:hypothetical protein
VWNEDAAEVVVKNVHDLAAISMEDTIIVEKTFDGVSTLLLAVGIDALILQQDTE